MGVLLHFPLARGCCPCAPVFSSSLGVTAIVCKIVDSEHGGTFGHAFDNKEVEDEECQADGKLGVPAVGGSSVLNVTGS